MVKRFEFVCALVLAVTAGFSSPNVTVKYDLASAAIQIAVNVGIEANAQVGPPPVCPPICLPPPPPSPSTPDTSDHGGHWGKVTVESILQMQAASIGCSAVLNIADSMVRAGVKYRRELTPVEAIDNSAACGSLPAIIIKVLNWANGVKDNKCSLDVARHALLENNSIRAVGELPWPDGSFERRQAKFLEQYAACYRRSDGVD
jgi:hypothetical protein